jgi:signal transduction histidine kinase
VRRLFAAESGGLLAALGHSGVLRLEAGRPTGRVVGPSDAENSVFAIHEDRDGTTWVGTAAGLRLIEGDRFVLPDGIPRIQRPVYFILRDHDERLWIGTDNGALRWDGRSLSSFSVAQGLAAPETNRAAGCLDSRGRIWIGTNFGLSIYREEWERAEPVAPLVRLEWVLAGGEERELLEEIELRAHDNDLTFRARAVSFVDEGRVLLHSRLAGLEPAPQVTTGAARRELRYASLPPGRYRLEVQAESVDGTASDLVLSPWITIAPPLWRRPAFLGVAVLLLAGLLYLTHRFLAQRRYASELAAEVERRMARIREVEEELTRSRRLESLAVFAGGLAHDFNNLLTVILGNLSILRLRLAGREIDTRPLEDAEGAVKRATELTGQFLTFARGGGPIREVRDVAAIVRESAALVFAGTNATCDLRLSEGLWNAEVDAGQLTQVFNNLMLNAVQAMPGGGTVTVRAGNVEEVPAPMDAEKGVHVSISDE